MSFEVENLVCGCVRQSFRGEVRIYGTRPCRRGWHPSIEGRVFERSRRTKSIMEEHLAKKKGRK